ncbi:hypothetical protein EG329_014019 [Mollisiaceae sp. DMI_Dod_QoI]|nr:hypothetical protein EG329_014019 [Helotiales sp. DMI_Dod_QoI]
MRTDFLRKPPMTPSSTAGSTPGRNNTMKGRVTSLFRKSRGPNMNPAAPGAWSPGLAPPIPLNIQKNGGGGIARPVTPPNQREPSGYFQEIPLTYDDGASSHRSPPQMQTRTQVGNGGGGGGLRVSAAADPRQSYMTTTSDFLERDRSNANTGGALAGLPKGQREFPSPLTSVYVSASSEDGDGFVPTPLTSTPPSARNSWTSKISSTSSTRHSRPGPSPSPSLKTNTKPYWVDARGTNMF